MGRAAVQANILIDSANVLSGCTRGDMLGSLERLRDDAANLASSGVVYSSEIAAAIIAVKGADNYVCPIINK